MSGAAQAPNPIVSTVERCETKHVTKLGIFDLGVKLRTSGDYDIGGSCKDGDADFWFYYTTTVGPGANFLLNLYVCSRKIIEFRIGISNGTEITVKKSEGEGVAYLPDDLEWHCYQSSVVNENNYIKTFNFVEEDIHMMKDKVIYIPMKIDREAAVQLDEDIMRSIKINHYLSGPLLKHVKTDFVLESGTGKTFKVHKIILAAFSPQLRKLVKNKDNSKAVIDIEDEEMELLLEFLYTGLISEIWDQDCKILTKLAVRFQLRGLFEILQIVMFKKIDIDNAVGMAMFSEKYQLVELQHKIFSFIKKNPTVFQTEGWKNLNNVVLAKKLIQFLS